MSIESFIRVPNPPPPMSWEEYERIVLTDWDTLLGSIREGEEKRVQEFLETHPCIIPGAYSFPLPSGHYPFPAAVISQPPLKGLTTKRPDFLWLGTDSGTFHVVLVEIESPTKQWFTKKGVPHSSLTQAQAQLASWKQWFDVPENKAIFLKSYKVPPSLLEKAFNLVCVLVYGRRSEFEGAPALSALRRQLERPGEHLMTFDRLFPDPKSKDLMCVRLTESFQGTHYEAISIPPTLHLTNYLAPQRSLITKREEVVQQSTRLTKERKAFLLERFPYWDNWAKEHRGSYQMYEE
jgi:hypothetical protein